MSDDPSRPRPFRWTALLQRAGEAVFVLDRRRRLLFVNAAWERLTETPAEQAHGLLCRRSRPPGPDSPPEDVLAHILTPPPEALHGGFARVRRLYPEKPRGACGPQAAGPRWWDIEFLPLRQDGPGEGYLFLGRILPLGSEKPGPAVVLPERLMDLRQQWANSFTLDLLDGAAPAMQRLLHQARLASSVRAPVWLVGEPGAGKETAARIIHYQSSGRESAFAVVDCRRLPAALLAGVLFGAPAAGRPALGAVYLREPTCLPRDVQLRLAEWLNRKASAGPGEDAGPRLFAGSSRRPEEDVRSGGLREDLSWLLGPLTLEIPPLRERRDDLPRLAERMLALLNAQGEQRATGLTPAAAEALRRHAWPGNLAELRQVLADAWTRAPAERIDVADLPAALVLPQRLEQAATRAASRPVPLKQTLVEVERRLIRLALRRARGHRARAAELLGIYRARLLRRMQALKMPEAEGDEAEAP